MLFIYEEFTDGLNFETLHDSLLEFFERYPEIEFPREYIKFEKIAELLIGQRFLGRGEGACTVISYDLEDFTVTILPDNGDKATEIGFLAFASGVSFENPSIDDMVKSHLAYIETLYKLAAALGEITVKYELALLYMFKGMPEHKGAPEYLEKAIKLCHESATSGFYSAQNALLPFSLTCIENDHAVDPEILRYAIEKAREQAEDDDYLAQYNLGWYYSHTGHTMESIHYYERSFNNPEAIPPVKADIAYTIAPYYKDGVKDSDGRYLLYKDLKKAKQYYECAASRDYECEADLEYVNRMLGIEPTSNLMLQLAKRISDGKKPLSEQYQQVAQDIKTEFGELWDALPHNSQVDLVSGCVVYVNLYSLGKEICEQLDFSASIIPIVKACEIVFRKYLAMGYYDYLADTNIPATSLNSRHPFVEFDRVNRGYAYKAKDKIEFTLGSIRWILEVQNGPFGQKTVSKHFLDYACKVCNCQTTTERYRLESYFVSLSRRMSQFTFDIRNPAAHSDVMPIWQAEICGNEIIKVRRVLKEFMEKIDPMYY